jgi:hypothetical protein
MTSTIINIFKKQTTKRVYIPCSQCKNPMDKKLGDIQVEYERVNAPICCNCVVAEPRDEDNKPIAPDGSKVIYKQLIK